MPWIPIPEVSPSVRQNNPSLVLILWFQTPAPGIASEPVFLAAPRYDLLKTAASNRVLHFLCGFGIIF
jgi:hypothetical protein